MDQQRHSPQPEKIRQMFSQVAAKYDQANSVLSMGIHHLWRAKLVKLVGAKVGMSVLDCATGTGDLALEFKKAVGETGQVIGTDFCKEMLEPAPLKAKNKNLDIKFEVADVMNLQFQNDSFDISSISFGIRNVADPIKGLSEMARVVKPGGKVIVLEFGQATLPGFAQIFNFYSDTVLPILGGLITGQKEAYRYLQKSSSLFPCRQDFLKLMNQTEQLENCKFYSLTGGVAYIYVGTKKQNFSN